MARRRVLPIPHERAVDKQLAAVAQQAPGAGDEVLRHPPGRDVQHVNAEHGGERSPGLPVRCPRPSGIGEIDALWRTQVCKPRVPSPSLDAGEMRWVNIARPPGEVRRQARKLGNVLPGAAAEFQHVALLRAQETGHRRPDGVVVAMKGRAIQPSVRRGRRAGFSEFDDEFGHCCEGINRPVLPASHHKPRPKFAVKASITRSHRRRDYAGCLRCFYWYNRAISRLQWASPRSVRCRGALMTGFKNNLGGFTCDTTYIDLYN